MALYPIWHYIRWHYNRYALYFHCRPQNERSKRGTSYRVTVTGVTVSGEPCSDGSDVGPKRGVDNLKPCCLSQYLLYYLSPSILCYNSTDSTSTLWIDHTLPRSLGWSSGETFSRSTSRSSSSSCHGVGRHVYDY